ncbi:MAG: TetR/AcrR family transcriptional regulator [Acidimicrobiales bacterium]
MPASTTTPATAPAKTKATKWGDRRQRRIDILDAARAQIAEGGYRSLNMRDLAAAAGVSPATLYSYFATKEQLFATLYAQAIRAHTEAYRPVAEAGHGLAALLAQVIEAHIELYRTYGRYFTLWSALRHDAAAQPGGFPPELVDELRTATREHNRLLMDSIRAAAARDGRHVADERMVPSFLWSVLTGLADHVTSERRALDGYPAERLVRFAADRLALAITDPGTAPES